MNENDTFAYVLKLANQVTLGNLGPEEEAVINEHFDIYAGNSLKGNLFLQGDASTTSLGL